MFDLKCKKYDCEFNKNGNCSANNITIKSNTYCVSFKKTSVNNENKIEKINQPAIRKNIKVDCNVDCIFNKNNICSANGITMQPYEKATSPICCTFQPK